MTRKYTTQLLEIVEQGHVDKDILIRDLLGWMSEADVEEFALRNDYIAEEEEDLDEDEEECEYCNGDGYDASGKGYDGDGKTCPFCSPDWGSIGPPT